MTFDEEITKDLKKLNELSQKALEEFEKKETHTKNDYKELFAEINHIDYYIKNLRQESGIGMQLGND